ncbi:MAG: HAD-IA family hydrolase [Candidatus Altiarchaeales archaeon]|nr:HAD-IA family hydrolase [Candidatus Altiarchaeales archaeon]MBD3415954.1 HAD-IA family hydrolase [Candidatus Altiarchaeales archaeon]
MAELLVFDFDGTLVDSIGSVWAEFQNVMETMDLEKVTRAEFNRHVGRSWDDVIRSLWRGIDPAEFTRHYNIRAEKASLFEGEEEALKKLSKGHTLAIMTGRGRETLYNHIRAASLDLSLFKAVYHKNNLEYPKPDPRSLEQVCRELGFEPSDSVYVGDSIVDAECSSKAGVGFIGVLSGGTSREEFSEWGVTDTIRDVTELPAHPLVI